MNVSIDEIKKHYSVENSYVISIDVMPYVLHLKMDFFLTTDHPEYVIPPENIWGCYRRGLLEIKEFDLIVWRAGKIKPAYDATGEFDYGNLDTLEVIENRIQLVGDWGEIETFGGIISAVLLDGVLPSFPNSSFETKVAADPKAEMNRNDAKNDSE